MIPLWITVFAFASVAYITGARTYKILAFSALVNVYIDTYTSPDDQYLMVVYSSIEFFTALGILYYGDIHKLFQTVILALMLLTHYTMEYALAFDKVEFIDSGAYTYIISALIVSQLIGAGRGLDKLTGLSGADNYRSQADNLGFLDHQKGR
jgi:hypothetical protein